MKLRISTIFTGIFLLGTLTAAAGCGSPAAATTKTTQILTSAATASPTSTPLTPTTTETTTIHTAQTESANGLRLSLSLDATTYKTSQEISIVLDEQNARSTANKIDAAQNWPLAKLAVGPCGTLNYPFGMAVFKGYFSIHDVAAATPLTLYDPGAIYHCPLILSGITAYNFKALSDTADIIGACEPNPCLPDMTMKTEIPVKGYWTTGSLVNFNNFDPGIYTVVGGDEWGNLVVLHFTVTEPTTTSTAIQPQQAVAVQSVAETHINGQPVNPAGPQIAVFLQNNTAQPIVSLSVVLTELGNRSFDFDFGVTGTDPFLPGKTISTDRYLVGGGFGGDIPYSLKISGTFQDGSAFSEVWNSPAN